MPSTMDRVVTRLAAALTRLFPALDEPDHQRPRPLTRSVQDPVRILVTGRLAVQTLGLGGTLGLPGLDDLTDDRVHGLGERGAGLVHGDVEQADGLIGEYLAGVTGDGLPFVLPADAADPQPGQFIAAQPGE
jgi:hypothetical protein